MAKLEKNIEFLLDCQNDNYLMAKLEKNLYFLLDCQNDNYFDGKT